jgi:putative heme iron utilization protein
VAKNNNNCTAEEIIEEVTQFRQKYRTLILASCSPGEQPLASYAPFIEDEQGHFYLLLSGLASHSQNLQYHEQTHKPVSILLIEDEQESRNLFARKRLSYVCEVTVWSRDNPQWNRIIQQMKDRLGNTIEVLVGLADFQLHCLRPVQGNYVRGFGQAYELKDAKHPILVTG